MINKIAIFADPQLDKQIEAIVYELQQIRPYNATLGKNMATIGGYYLWVDDTGDVRILSSIPTTDLDGVVVGTQS